MNCGAVQELFNTQALLKHPALLRADTTYFVWGENKLPLYRVHCSYFERYRNDDNALVEFTKTTPEVLVVSQDSPQISHGLPGKKLEMKGLRYDPAYEVAN
jgi:hypothetical protein